jgi:hypothetical protein
MNKRYRLIKPFVSNKIYETRSLKKGAKKCYEEVKMANNPDITSFTLMDIDTRQEFIGQIHHQYPIITGGNPPIVTKEEHPETMQEPVGMLESAIKQLNSGISTRDSKIEEIETNLKILEGRVMGIELQIANTLKENSKLSHKKTTEENSTCQKKDNGCNIM